MILNNINVQLSSSSNHWLLIWCRFCTDCWTYLTLTTSCFGLLTATASLGFLEWGNLVQMVLLIFWCTWPQLIIKLTPPQILKASEFLLNAQRPTFQQGCFIFLGCGSIALCHVTALSNYLHLWGLGMDLSLPSLFLGFGYTGFCNPSYRLLVFQVSFLT